MKNPLPGILNKSSSRINKLKRTIRSARNGLPKSKSPLRFQSLDYKQRIISILSSLRRVLIGRTGLFLLVTLAGLGGLYGFVRYFSYSNQFSPLDWDHHTDDLVGDNINILLVVYDEKDEYSFVDFLAVLAVSRSDTEHQLIVVNPDFGVSTLGSPVKLRNLLSNAEVADLSPMDTLMTGTEGLLGIKLDRYVSVKTESLNNYFIDQDAAIFAYDSVTDSNAGSFVVGEQVSGSQLSKYLAAEGKKRSEQRMWRQSRFMNDFLRSNLGFTNGIRLLLNYDYLTEIVESDMSREELTGLLTIMMSKPGINTTYLKTTDSYFVESDFGGGIYQANLGAIDRQVKDIFYRIEVVKEQGRVEVYNGTRTSGLASRTRRLIENLGGNVIRSANSPDPAERTVLYVEDPELYPENIELIRQVMANRLIVVEDRYPLQHVGELVLVIGEDFVSGN